jgi:hypothetical protein
VSNAVGAGIHRAFLLLDSYYTGQFPVFFLPVLSGDPYKGLVLAPVPSKGSNVLERVGIYSPDLEVKNAIQEYISSHPEEKIELVLI